ncbi:transposase-like protein, partial [Paenibacillus sp. PastF-2]|nr:transposase-like protein [Paenibacillus sp. PastF-2]MDF9851865.1 transposase-like protein [Paenibacillus sp. PastM-2]
GFSQAIAACYPQTEIQKCIIHQIRSSTRYVSYKDIKKVTADLKPFYKAATEESALLELDRFEKVWGAKYPLIIRSWRTNWDELATFFKYPPKIRKLIYTTNMIESYHRQLRKVTKGKSIFPTDEALLKMLYLATVDVSRHRRRHSEMDGTCPKLGPNAAPAVGLLPGSGRSTLALDSRLPPRGNLCLKEFTQNY